MISPSDMNTIITDGFQIFESRLNKPEEHFETIESTAFFANDSFAKEIKSNMAYYGISFDGLAKSLNITNFRLGSLLNSNSEFTLQEIKLIRNRLHF